MHPPPGAAVRSWSPARATPGLHVALRLTAKLRDNPKMELTLVDRHDYHQALTELPRVAVRMADHNGCAFKLASPRSAPGRPGGGAGPCTGQTARPEG